MPSDKPTNKHNSKTSGSKHSASRKSGAAAAKPPNELKPQTQTKNPGAKSSPENRQFPVVGIGASAGGLETFKELLKNLPGDLGMSFVLVQHLDPKHASILAELLVKDANMPVLEATDDIIAEVNHIYVIPPNVDMAILHGRLHLLPRPPEARKPSLPIDFFFKSLAQDRGSKAIGIVLSGTASDGAQGLKAVKAEGGITIAQDPSTAKYDGMPRAAIAAGGVDFVLSIAGIVGELSRIARHPYVTQTLDAETVPEVEDTVLNKIFILLRSATGVDFAHYKPSTIKRRITRRMVLYKLERLEDYLRYLQDHTEEAEALYDDILITVTEFFRDPETFELLKQEVFPKIVRDKSPETPIRIWVAGCATGEEAYSMAMSLLEFLGGQTVAPPIQIFATDIHESSIEKARRGFYSESIAENVSPARLRRFFVKVEGGYQINRMIRDMCVFAKHDVTRDPPFSRLDLITCRNVLIYLGPVLQNKVIPMFHWALNPAGFLLLGASETVSQHARLFELIDRKYKIYVRKAAHAKLPADFTPQAETAPRHYEIPARTPLPRAQIPREFDLVKEADRVVLDRYAPAGVVIDENLDILQFRGHTSPYLEPAPGRASLNLLDMARPGIKMDLRAAVFQSRKTNTLAAKERLRIKYNGDYRDVNIEVSPIKAPNGETYYLVLFQDATPLLKTEAAIQKRRKAAPIAEEERQVNQFKRELAETKEYLQTIIEERDVTNEELRASNEELQSSTEELQSINEELETAKEELQSSNEELTTVNEELHNRNIELTLTNNDLTNLLVSVNIPIVILGSDFTIRRITPPAEKVLNLRAHDVGRLITDISLRIGLPDLEHLLSQSVETVSMVEREVQDSDGRWYSLQIRPYITAEKKIEGAVLVLVDINELKQNQLEIQGARDYAQTIVETIREPLIVLDANLRVISANRSFYDTFRTSAKETENILVYEIGKHLWDIPELRKLLEDILPKKTQFDDFEITFNFPEVGQRTMLLNGRQMFPAQKDKPMILLAIEDITERKQIEEALRYNEQRFRAIADTAADAIITIDSSAKIVLWNQAAEKIFGYKSREALGRDITVIVPERYRAAHKKALANYLTTGKATIIGKTLEMEGLRKNGSEFPVELSVAVWETGEETFFTGIIRDITERKVIESTLKEAKELSEGLNSINSVIHSSLDFDEIMQAVVIEAVKALGCDSSAVILREPGYWTIKYVSGLPEEPFGTKLTDGEAKHLTLVEQTKKPLIIDDAFSDPRVNRSLMKKYSLRSLIYIPLIVKKAFIGVMAFHYRSRATAFTERQIDFATKLAVSVSLALENAHLYDEEQKAKKLSDTLNDINSTAISTLDSSQIIERIVVRSAEAIGAETAALTVREGSFWVTRYLHALPQERLGLRFTDQEAPHAVLATERKKPVCIEDALNDPRVNPEIMRQYDVRSVLALPLTTKEEAIGVIFFNYHSATHFFDQAEVDFATKLAVSVSLALENAHLYNEERKAKKLSDTLNNINSAISSTLDYDRIMQQAVVNSANVLGAESAGITLREDDEWAVKYVYKLPQAAGRRITTKEVRVTMDAANSGKPLFIADTYNDRRINRDLVELYEIRSMLIVPLTVRDEALGGLFFNYHSAPVTLADMQLDFAEKLGTSISLAIENARLYTADIISPKLCRGHCSLCQNSLRGLVSVIYTDLLPLRREGWAVISMIFSSWSMVRWVS